jgi:hypothetical protein
MTDSKPLNTSPSVASSATSPESKSTAAPSPQSSSWRSRQLHPGYLQSVRFGLWLQGILLILSSFCMCVDRTEGPWLFFGIFVFWPGVFLIAWRRPEHPTRGDLLYVRVGYLLIMVLAPMVAGQVWTVKEKVHLTEGLPVRVLGTPR